MVENTINTASVVMTVLSKVSIVIVEIVLTAVVVAIGVAVEKKKKEKRTGRRDGKTDRAQGTAERVCLINAPVALAASAPTENFCLHVSRLVA